MAAAEYEFSKEKLDSVIEIYDMRHLNNLLREDQHILLELFSTNDQSRQFEFQYVQVASAFHRDTPNVKVARVNITSIPEAKTVAMLEGEEPPAFRLFLKGTKKPVKYIGPRTDADLLKWVNSNTKSKAVLTQTESLTSSSFNKIVMNPKKNVLVEFYAPWCGFCKKLAPEYEAVGLTFSKDAEIVVAKIDVTKERGPAERFKVNGFPTLKFFPAGKHKKAVEYDGGRDGASLVKFLNQYAAAPRVLGGALSSLFGRAKEIDSLAGQFISTSSVAEKKNILNEFRGMRSKYVDDAAKGLPIYEEVMEKILNEGEDWIKQERDRVDSMLADLSPFKGIYPQYKLRKNILDAFSPDWEDAYVDSFVTDLDESNFDSVVDGSKDVFVEFYAPWCGHCKQLAPEYELVAKQFKKSNSVVVAKVDATAAKAVGDRFDIKGFPTLKFFPKGRKSPVDYNGGRNAAAISRYIREQANMKEEL
eukprot:GILJ01003222.1.p1 GENE.GILJ01003222.1~~GILJ01003222.1.p1  ORF type:complete len:506 (-),score=101.83 GILJ01003222.1:92-1516(-)